MNGNDSIYIADVMSVESNYNSLLRYIDAR